MLSLSVKRHGFTDKLFKINNLSVETCHLTDKLHFESQWYQELVARAL